MAYLDDEKLNENTEVTSEEVTNNQQQIAETEVVVEESDEKQQILKTDSKKKEKKSSSKIKGTFGELKKVTWPSFGKVVKQTAIVLSVTLVFLVIIMGIDQLLYFLFNLIQPK